MYVYSNIKYTPQFCARVHNYKNLCLMTGTAETYAGDYGIEFNQDWY